jgi:molybdopterin converting factor subunit 1
MKVTVNYFAILRDERGLSSEEIDLAQGTTPEVLYSDLKQKYNFTLTKCKLKVAINDEFSNWQQLLKEADSIVFIPPVAGG